MNNLIVVDTREKGHKKILEYFELVEQNYIISKLEAADYMIYKDYTVLIDKKDGVAELCKNLCNKSEHQRVTNEIDKAHKLGCKRFIFLIQDSKVKDIEDVKKWFSPYTKVKGYQLYKIMKTFAEHHNCEYLFTTQSQMGQTIIDLLIKK